MSLRIVMVLGVVVLAACGGKQDDPSTSDAGADADKAADAQPPLGPDCPTSQPADGSACSKESLECEYGSDPRYSCNFVARCDQGKWSVSTSNDMYCPTPATNPSACPVSYAAGSQGGSCPTTAEGVPCHYAEGWCSCMYAGGPPTPDGGGPESIWACFDMASTTAGCPATRPRLGTPCNAPDLDCDYSPCGTPSGLAVRCDVSNGTWTESFGAPCGGAGSN